MSGLQITVKYVTTTIEGGDAYRVVEETGEIRTVEVASMFGGAGQRTDKQVRAYSLVHPDDVRPGMETIMCTTMSSCPCGIGAYIGLEWV